MSHDEPEASLTRAALVMVLGATLLGLGLGSRGGHGAISQTLLAGGGLLVAGAVLATVKGLYQHWKDRSR